MEVIHIAIACMAALILGISLFARRLRHNILSEPFLALMLGIAIGPIGLGWFEWGSEEQQRTILGQTALFTLALILISVGLEPPRRYLAKHWGSLTVLTLGGMLLMWSTSALLLVWILGLDLLSALLIGAVLTPIDPVLAASVVMGRNSEQEVPGRIRYLLSFESAATHGLGYVLVLLPIYLNTKTPGHAWTHWLTHGVLWDGFVAAAIGAFAGYVAGNVQRWSLQRNLTDRGVLITTFVGLSLSLVTLLELIGSNGLLAVVVAGILYARTRKAGSAQEDGEELKEQEKYYKETFKELLQVPVFVLLGAALPWGKWMELGWAGMGLILAVLLLRRLPVVLLLKPFIPQLHRWDETLFVAWFGPVGVGALHFALLAQEHTGMEQVWVVGSLIIFASMVVHDLTSEPFSRWLQRRLEPAQNSG